MKKSAQSSCFIRVAQNRAGRSFGTWFLPRIGQDVVDAFEEDDPDRPLVLGSVYNAENTVPFAPSGNRTKGAQRTRSSLNGDPSTFSEPHFEDRKGWEEVFPHAESNLNTGVEYDTQYFVGHDEAIRVDHDRTTHIKRDDILTVDNDQTQTIRSNAAAAIDNDLTATMHGNETHIVDKNVIETARCNETVLIGHNRAQTVGPGDTLSVGTSRTQYVGAAETITIGGSPPARSKQPPRGFAIAVAVKKQHHAVQDSDLMRQARS